MTKEDPNSNKTLSNLLMTINIGKVNITSKNKSQTYLNQTCTYTNFKIHVIEKTIKIKRRQIIL